MATDYNSDTIGQKLDETGQSTAANLRETREDVRGLDRGTTGTTAGYAETVSPAAGALGDSATTSTQGADVHGKCRRVLSTSTLTVDRVRNAAGEDLGKIEEIMIDLDSGRIAYAVLSFGGFLGIGEHNVAVPFSSLQWAMHSDKNVNNNAAAKGAAATNGTTTQPHMTASAPATSSAQSGTHRDYPDHAILPNASKDELKKAPQFNYAS